MWPVVDGWQKEVKIIVTYRVANANEALRVNVARLLVNKTGSDKGSRLDGRNGDGERCRRNDGSRRDGGLLGLLHLLLSRTCHCEGGCACLVVTRRCGVRGAVREAL